MTDASQMRIQTTTPMHMVLVLDNSGSLHGDPARAVTEAVQSWITELQAKTRGKKEWFLFTTVVFGSQVQTIVQGESVNSLDPESLAIEGDWGTTNMSGALREAASVISKVAEPHHCPPFVFVLSDGVPDDGGSETRAAATALKGLSLPCGSPRVVTLGFGDVDDTLMKDIATSPEFYARTKDADALIALLPALGTPTGSGASTTIGGLESEIAAQIKEIQYL